MDVAGAACVAHRRKEDARPVASASLTVVPSPQTLPAGVAHTCHPYCEDMALPERVKHTPPRNAAAKAEPCVSMLAELVNLAS